jgi:hypothetical protein
VILSRQPAFINTIDDGIPMMLAVVFKGPNQVVLEERPIPQIQQSTDIIVKIKYTAICGRLVLGFPILFDIEPSDIRQLY